MCSGFIAAATDTGKTGLKNQTADGLYYAVRYPSYMASATVRPEGARSIATMATRRGYQMGRWLAGRLMNEPGGLVSCQQSTHRYKRGGYEHVAISDYLERQFAVTGPNKVWCGDVTYIWTGIALGGYLAVVLDLFARKPVGWAMSFSPDSRLTMKALEMAWETRGKPGGVMLHSDSNTVIMPVSVFIITCIIESFIS